MSLSRFGCRPRALFLSLFLLAGGVAGPTELQADPMDPRFSTIDALIQSGDLGMAYRAVERMLASSPSEYDGLWRAASIAVALGVTLSEGVAVRTLFPGEARSSDPVHWYREAGRWVDAAMRVRPHGIEGRYWRIAVLGQEAFRASSPREASELSDRMRELALSILADQPNHAGAHNALGRVYLEIMSVGGVTRMLGRTFVRGDALTEASWERAEHHLRRAVALDPQSAMYRLDLARFLVARGSRSEARAALEDVVRIGGDRPTERPFVAEARRLLDRARG
jgi:tetratricopeptide (TPR) repeat protein